jgi:integrase
VLDGQVVPNGRRDEFESNVHLDNLIAHLRPVGAEVARECRVSSQKRNRLKTFELAADKIYEKLDVLKQGAVSGRFAKTIKAEISTLLSEMRKAVDFDLFEEEDRCALRSRLVEQYKHSPEFAWLRHRTRADYEKILHWLDRMNDVPVGRISTPDIVRIRDAAVKERQYRFANYVLSLLSVVFKFGRLRGLCPDNPARDVPKIPRPKGKPRANRPWRDREVRAVLDAASPVMRVAVCLAVFQGLRQGDVLSLTWNQTDDGYIDRRQNKTDDRIHQPLHSETVKALSAINRRAALIITTEMKTYGTHTGYTESGFRAMFFRLIKSLEKAELVGTGLTFHGLRHTFATALADHGEDDKTIAAATGHRSESMVQRYTAHADRSKRAVRAIDARERSWNEKWKT